MKKIEAGLLADITNLIKTLSNSLFKFVDKLIDVGAVVQKQEQTKDGGVKMQLLIDKQVVNIEVTPAEDEKQVDVLIKYEGGKDIILKGVYKDKIEESIVKELKDRGLNYSFEEIESSKKLSVTLRKVISKTSTDIKLMAINANYNPGIAMQDLDTVLYEDSFIDLLSEDEQSFDITDDGDSFNITPVSTVDIADTCETMLFAAMRLFFNLKTIHWNAAGQGFLALHDKLDEYAAKVLSDIDTLGELCVEINGHSPNPGKLPCTDDLLCGCAGFQKDSGFDIVKDEINAYILVLSAYSVNFDSAVQGELDNSIGYWTKEANYKLKRMRLN